MARSNEGQTKGTG